MADETGRNISFQGSAFCTKFRDRYLLLCTSHQLKGTALDRICLPGLQEGRVISSGGFGNYTSQSGAPLFGAHDLAYFDFTGPVQSGLVSPNQFLNLNELTLLSRDDTTLRFYFAIGFANADDETQYSLGEDFDFGFQLDAIHGKKRILVCEALDESSDDEHVNLQRLGDRVVHPGGFSGGPVFCLVEAKNGEFAVKFSGITQMGGTSNLYALRSQHVMHFLDEIDR